MCLICSVFIHSNIQWYSSPNVSHVSHSLSLYGKRARPLPLTIFSNLWFLSLNLVSASRCFFTFTRIKYLDSLKSTWKFILNLSTPTNFECKCLVVFVYIAEGMNVYLTHLAVTTLRYILCCIIVF